MPSIFSISFQYVVLAVVCAAVAQGNSSPVVGGGFQLGFPSQCAARAEKQVAPWVHHLQFPTSGPLKSFNQWSLVWALDADVPTLSLAMQWGSKLVVPKGSRGATRGVTKSVLPTTIHVGLSGSQPLNQTQLDQVRSLLSGLLPKQPEQAPPPLTGRLRGKTIDPAADGSTDVSPLQKAFVASMFGGLVSVGKLDFDTKHKYLQLGNIVQFQMRLPHSYRPIPRVLEYPRQRGAIRC